MRPPIVLEVGARLTGLASCSWQQTPIQRALRVLQEQPGQPPSNFRLTLLQGPETEYRLRLPEQVPLHWNFKAPGLVTGPFEALKNLGLEMTREPLHQQSAAWTYSPSKAEGADSGLVSFWAWEVLLIQLGLLCLPGQAGCADSAWQRWLSMKELLGFTVAEAD